jgi:DNA-binding MarR family transcriptional regulator
MTAVAKKARASSVRTNPRARPLARAAAKPAAGENEALELGVLNDVMGFRLRRIQNHLAKAFSEQTNHPGKPGVFSILALIAANPGVSQVRLAQESGVDKTALVAVLDYIEHMDWAVRRRATEDRRKHSLSLTKKGEAALTELTERAHQAEEPARASLTAVELAQLLNLLDKLYSSCFREEVL